jgi:hypothetical protein
MENLLVVVGAKNLGFLFADIIGPYRLKSFNPSATSPLPAKKSRQVGFRDVAFI